MRISDWSSDVCSSDLSIASLRIATASGRRVDLSKSKFTPFRSIDTGTGQPSGPMVWPACESGHLSSQSFTPSPSLSMSAQLGAAGAGATGAVGAGPSRSEEHTSELQSLMRISYAVFCLKKKTHNQTDKFNTVHTAD